MTEGKQEGESEFERHLRDYRRFFEELECPDRASSNDVKQILQPSRRSRWADGGRADGAARAPRSAQGIRRPDDPDGDPLWPRAGEVGYVVGAVFERDEAFQ